MWTHVAAGEREPRARAIVTGFSAGGAVLAGIGIGLVSWGGARLHRANGTPKGRASMVLPMVSLTGVGLVARVTF